MKFILSTTILVSILLIINVEARWKPIPGMTWNYVLGDDNFNVHSEKAQVIDVDYNKSAKTIQEYHNAGKKVICYFSGGTIEKHRKDIAEFNKVEGLVRNKYEEWADENWLDIRKEGLKPLLKNRMKEAVSKNCDGLEVDNLDGFQQSEVKSWSSPLTRADTVNFAKWLGNTAHELGISIGLKNALFMIDEVGGYFDFAINESCATLEHPECHLYKPFLNQGKAVFGVSYESRMSSNTNFCSSLNGLNISMIVKKDQFLRQEGYIFDGKSQCGSNFKTGSSGSNTSNSNTSNSNTSNSNTSNSKNSSNNQSNKANNKITDTIKGSDSSSTDNNTNNTKDGNNNEGNSTSNSNDKNNKANENEDITNPDGSSSENNHKGTIITGILITTGSVASAAGILVLKKKNPRKYEDFKRTISRKASSAKRSATLVTKKLKTRKPKRANYKNNKYEYYDIDALNNMDNNPFNNYRYQFTKNFEY